MEVWGWVVGLTAMAVSWGCVFACNWVFYLPRLRAGQAPYPNGSLGLPLVGQTLQLFRDFKQCPDNFLRKRIARYGKGGGLLKTHLFGSPTIIAITPDTLRAVSMDSENFAPGWPKHAMKLAGGKSFLAHQGEEYKRLRRLASSAINSPHTLGKVVILVESIFGQALRKWSHMGQFLLINELLKVTFDVIATVLVGKLPDKEIEEFCDEFHVLNNGLRALPFNIPGFAYRNALKARQKIEKRLRSYIDNRVAYPSVVHGDVLESLMNMVDEEGKTLSSEEVIDSLITFLLAGHESSAHLAMWIFIFLFKNPSVLEKLTKEQTRISMDKNGSHHHSIFEYKKMTYLHSVIEESLRIVNISPYTFRKSIRTIELNGYTIPKDWSIALWHRANHMDEEIFVDPYAFNPERWKDIKLKPGMYTPFGLGARSCIGMDLAKLELAVLVHNLVLNYRWELANPDADIVYLPRPKPIDNCLVQIYPK